MLYGIECHPELGSEKLVFQTNQVKAVAPMYDQGEQGYADRDFSFIEPEAEFLL